MRSRHTELMFPLILCALLLLAPITGAVAAVGENSASHWEWTLSSEEHYLADQETSPDGDHAYVLFRTEYPELQRAVVMKVSADGSIVWRKSYDPPINGNAELIAKDSQVVVRAENFETDAVHTTVFTAEGEKVWAEGRRLTAEGLVDGGYLRVTDGDSPTVQRMRYGNGVLWETDEFDSVSHINSDGDQILVVGTPEDGQQRLSMYSSDGARLATAQFDEPADIDRLFRWRGNILARTPDALFLFESDLTRSTTISGVSEYVTTEEGTFIVTDGGDVVKLTAEGDIAWKKEGVIGQYAADAIEYGPQARQVYVSGGASVDTENVAERNTTAVAALDAESGEIQFDQWVIHPDLGDAFHIVRRADDGSYLVSASGFGIAKLSSTGDVRWHISEDDDILTGPDNSSQKRGRLDYRTTHEHTDFARHPDGYVFITDSTATIVRPNGDLVASDRFAHPRSEPNAIDGGYLYQINSDSVGLLAAPARIDTDSIRDEPGVFGTIASLFGSSPTPAPQSPRVAPPGADLSTVSFETPSVAPSSPSSGFYAALSAFLQQMFSIQALIIFGAAVITVLIVRTWPGYKRK